MIVLQTLDIPPRRKARRHDDPDSICVPRNRDGLGEGDENQPVVLGHRSRTHRAVHGEVHLEFEQRRRNSTCVANG